MEETNEDILVQKVQVTEKGKENPVLNELIKKKRGRPVGWRGTYKKKAISEPVQENKPVETNVTPLEVV